MRYKREIISIVIALVILISVIILLYTSNANALSQTEVTLTSITISELHLSYCKIRLKIEISNPTSSDISELQSRFDVYISDSFVSTGEIDSVSIYAQSKTNQYVTLTIYYADIAGAAVSGIKNGNFDLKIDGEVQSKIFFNLITVSHSYISTKNYP